MGHPPYPDRTMSPRPPRHSRPAAPVTGQVRIIGGQWRNSKLTVPDSPGLRPTSDRVRETLFNWLMPKLPGAHVLDLFAGSGALGLEALSRGAASATLVERDPKLAAAIGAAVQRFGATEQADVQAADARTWLERVPAQRYDIAFVDPPFADGLWDHVLARLPAHLSDDAWLYVESTPQAHAEPGAGWQLHREGSTREVRYALYRRQGTATLGTVSHDTDHA